MDWPSLSSKPGLVEEVALQVGKSHDTSIQTGGSLLLTGTESSKEMGWLVQHKCTSRANPVLLPVPLHCADLPPDKQHQLFCQKASIATPLHLASQF